MRFDIAPAKEGLTYEQISFSFTLEFYDDPGNKFIQNITCVNGVIKIEPPSDVG
jgi:hypothetical protein